MQRALRTGDFDYMSRGILMASPRDRTRTLSMLLFMLGVSLNQSTVLYGTNLSFADFACVALITYLIMKKSFTFPRSALLFFLLIASVSLITSFYIMPLQFHYYPSLRDVFLALVKLIASLFYLLIGINLGKINQAQKLFMYFSYASFLIALGAVLTMFVRMPGFIQSLFYGGVRYKGLMNDPNYFAILQNIAIVYFIRTTHLRKATKIGIILVLIYSIMLSGSKTGSIALGASLFTICIGKTIREKKDFNDTLKFLGFTVAASIGSYYLWPRTIVWFRTLSAANYSFNRIHAMLTNLSGAVSGEGSARMETWKMALTLIFESPLFGVGIGTYTGITNTHYNYSAIAHNSYLQLATEWGLPLALIFFCILLLTYFRTVLSQRVAVMTLGSMLLIFLVGSFAISLNNARMFWIIFGAALYYNGKWKKPATRRD